MRLSVRLSVCSPEVVFPGTHAMIMLTAVQMKLLPKEGGSCVVDRDLKYFETYSFEVPFPSSSISTRHLCRGLCRTVSSSALRR